MYSVLLLFLLSPPALTAHARLFIDHDSALFAGGTLADLFCAYSFVRTLTARIPICRSMNFRAIENSRDKANLTRAASKINENLYASTALGAVRSK